MRWLILACCIVGCASFGNLPPPQACRGVGAWPASSSRVGRPEQNGRGLGRMIMCKAHGGSEDGFGIIPAAGPSAGQGQLGFRRVGGGEARAGGRTAMGMSGNMRRAEEWRKRGDRRWQVENEKRLTGRGVISRAASLLCRAVLAAWLFRMGELVVPALLAPLLSHGDTLQAIRSAPALLITSFSAFEATAMGILSTMAPPSVAPLVPVLAVLLAVLLASWHAVRLSAVSSWLFFKGTFLMGVADVRFLLTTVGMHSLAAIEKISTAVVGLLLSRGMASFSKQLVAVALIGITITIINNFYTESQECSAEGPDLMALPRTVSTALSLILPSCLIVPSISSGTFPLVFGSLLPMYFSFAAQSITLAVAQVVSSVTWPMVHVPFTALRLLQIYSMHVAIAGAAVSAPGLALGSATLLSLSAVASVACLTLDLSLVPDRYGVLRKVERADVEAVRDLRDEVASLRARTRLLTKDRENSLLRVGVADADASVPPPPPFPEQAPLPGFPAPLRPPTSPPTSSPVGSRSPSSSPPTAKADLSLDERPTPTPPSFGTDVPPPPPFPTPPKPAKKWVPPTPPPRGGPLPNAASSPDSKSTNTKSWTPPTPPPAEASLDGAPPPPPFPKPRKVQSWTPPVIQEDSKAGTTNGENNAVEERPAAENKVVEDKIAADAKKKEEDKIAADAKKKEEDKIAADAKKKEEDKIAADAKKKEEDKIAADAKKKEEDKIAADAKKKEEDKIAADAKKKEEDKIAADAKKKEEEERIAAGKKKAENEKEVIAADKKKAEEERIDAEKNSTHTPSQDSLKDNVVTPPPSPKYPEPKLWTPPPNWPPKNPKSPNA